MDADLAGLLRDVDLTTLGTRIREARLAIGQTQKQLAAGDVTVGYISRIEAGQRRPDLRLMRTLAARLHRSVESLVVDNASWADRHELDLTFAELAMEAGRPEEALAQAEHLLASPSLGSALMSHVRYLRGRALEATGEYDQAITELDSVSRLPLCRHWLPSMIAISRCYTAIGDFDRAVETGAVVKAHLSGLGLEAENEAIQLAQIEVNALFARGDVREAVRRSRETLASTDAVGSSSARAAKYWNASLGEARRGSPTAAIPLAERALTLLRTGSDARNLAKLRAQLGRMLLAIDPPDVKEAGRLLQQARDGLEASDATLEDIMLCELDIARSRLAEGELVAARVLVENCLSQSSGLAQSVAAGALTLLGQVAALEGDAHRAGERYRQAAEALATAEPGPDSAQSWLELGAHLEAAGDTDTARRAYRDAAISAGLSIPTSVRVRPSVSADSRVHLENVRLGPRRY